MAKSKKRISVLFTAAAFLAAVLMAGCSRPTEAGEGEKAEECGVYVRLERDDADSVFLHGGSFTKVCENADGSLLHAGEWIFMGEDIAQLSRTENRSILFRIGAGAADGTVLEEGSFLYDYVRGKLYVTIGADGVTCSSSDAPDAPADIAQVLTLPILEEIDAIPAGTTDASQRTAMQTAVRLIGWAQNTELGVDEISDTTSTWLAAKNFELTECLKRLALVDSAYQKLLTADARVLLDAADCADIQITWGSEPLESIEAIMQAAGQR